MEKALVIGVVHYSQWGRPHLLNSPEEASRADSRRVGHFFQSTNFTPGVEPNQSRDLLGVEKGVKSTSNMQPLQIAFNESTL